MARLDNEEVKKKKQRLHIECDTCKVKLYRPYYMREKGLARHGKDLCKGCAIRSSDAVGKKVSRKLTLTCEYCNKEYVVNYARRFSRSCSRQCQHKLKRTQLNEKKKTSLCIMCNKEFSHYGTNLCCSRECNGDYMSIIRVGENNPNFKPEKEKSICVACNVEFEYGRDGLHKGAVKKKCQGCRDKIREVDSSDSPKVRYNRGFAKLRLKIIERDNNCCQWCSSEEKLEVHHIDDDRSNDDEKNLITLCKQCHTMTKYNRDFWQRVLIGIGSNSKIVKKGWGLEIHFVNNDKYCLKYLVFFKGKKFSLHLHEIKQELWFCMWGSFKCKLIDNNGEENFKFSAGDKIEILPGVVHQLEALTNSIITEVSSTDYPEDSIRIEKGD